MVGYREESDVARCTRISSRKDLGYQLLKNPPITSDIKSLLLSPTDSFASQGSSLGTLWQYSRKMIKVGGGSITSIQTQPRQMRESEQSASVFGSIVNILATILGSGLLALPYAMAGCGVWPGIGVFVTVMILSTMSFLTLSKAVQVYTDVCEFKTLAHDTLPKQLNWMVDFCVFINCSGSGVGFLIVMSTLMAEVIQSFYPEAVSLLLNRRFWLLVFAGCTFPLVVVGQLEALKFTSFLGVICVSFTLGVMTYYAMEPREWGQPVVYYSFPGDVAQFLKVFAIIANAFACSQNVPCIVNNLVEPTQLKLQFILTTSVGISLVFYIIAAYAGYVTFGDVVDSDVLRSYPSELIPISIAQIAMTLALVGSYPVQLHPARESLSFLLFGVPAKKLKTFAYLNITICIWGTTVGVAWITDNFGTVSAFIGALAAIPLTFIYPNLFWIKVSPRLGPNQIVWPSWVILILGLTFVPISLSTELYKLYMVDE